MLKKLLFTTALSGLMLSAAMAQYSSPSGAGSGSTPPSASSDQTKSGSDAMKSDASKSTVGASASGSAQTISSQKPDQLLASKFKGADVIGSNDEKIGDVSDILFSKDGKIEAYILSVGGFLGVGAKEIALAPSSVQLMQEKDAFKVKVGMNKDQLAQAPNFEHYKEPRATTGAGSMGQQGPAGAPRGAPGGAPPSRP